MIALVQSLKVFLCTQPVDMRRSFDGLCGMASGLMQQEPLSGHLFVFRNRRADCLKILYWDQDGLAIWYKRLEQGSFQFPWDAKTTSQAAAATTGSLEVSVSDLTMLLQGIDLSTIQRRKRYELPTPKVPIIGSPKNIINVST